ncbi:MAG: hypothetical protein AABY22_11430 [Nanoarchaeota archaeon]
MAINLINPLKYPFGSIEWQEVMVNNICEKLSHREKLGAAEICFIQVQSKQDFKKCQG